MKKIFKKLLYPNTFILILIPFISFSLLIYCLINQTESIITYIIYTLSFYSLLILVLSFIKNFNNLKQKVKALINKNLIVKRYFEDYKFKASVSLFRGIIIDTIYMLFKLITGIAYSSVWSVSLAFYHLVLGLLRFYLFKNYKKQANNINEENYTAYKCGWFLVLLNIPMTLMAYLMIFQNSGFSYPGYIIYVNATYAFYIMSFSIYNLFKYKKVGSPILSSAKIINFIAALITMFALQSAMMTSFGNDSEFRFLMNVIFGTFVMIMIFATSMIWIIKGRKRIKNNYE